MAADFVTPTTLAIVQVAAPTTSGVSFEVPQIRTVKLYGEAPERASGYVYPRRTR